MASMNSKLNRKQNNETNNSRMSQPLKITDLNDDCLKKIFDCLDLISLFRVAAANAELRAAIRSVYRRRFGKKPVTLTPSGCVRISRMSETDTNIIILGLKACLQNLRYFGSSMENLEITYDQPERERYEYIHQYIGQYCAESLKNIAMRNEAGAGIPNFEKPMLNVQSVQVIDCDLGNQFTSFLEWFPNARTLELTGTRMNDLRIELPFQHLKVDITQQQATHLLPLCSRLISLEIRTSHQEISTLLDVIGNNKMICVLIVSMGGLKTVNPSEIQRLANEHPNLIEIDFGHYEFTADTAITLVRQLNRLKKICFVISNSSEYDRMVSQLDDQWQPIKFIRQSWDEDFHHVILTR